MSLSKGFLRSRSEFQLPPWSWRFTAVALWIGHSFFLYTFACGIREALRYGTAGLGPQIYLTLTDTEYTFYNFFFASLACAISFGYVFRSLIQLPSLRSRAFNFQKGAILGDLTIFPSLLLFVFTKVAFLFGIFEMMFPLHLYFSLYDHPFLTLSLPLIVFLVQWNSFIRIFKSHAIEPMLISFALFVGVSYAFTVFPLINSKKLDAFVKSQFITSYYDCDVPDKCSEAFRISGRDRADLGPSIYVAYPKNKPGEHPQVVLNQKPFRRSSAEEIREAIAEERSKRVEYEQFDLGVEVVVDKNVPLRYFKDLKNKIALSGCRLMYVAARKPGETSYETQTYFKMMLHNCDGYFAGMLGGKDSSAYFPPFCSRPFPNDPNLLSVVLKNNAIHLNGKPVALTDIYNACLRYVVADSKDHTVILYGDDSSTFGHYIATYNEIQRASRDAFDPFTQEKHGLAFRDAYANPRSPEHNDALNDVRQHFRFSLREISEVQKQYLLKTSPQLSSYFPSE